MSGVAVDFESLMGTPEEKPKAKSGQPSPVKRIYMCIGEIRFEFPVYEKDNGPAWRKDRSQIGLNDAALVHTEEAIAQAIIGQIQKGGLVIRVEDANGQRGERADWLDTIGK